MCDVCTLYLSLVPFLFYRSIYYYYYYYIIHSNMAGKRMSLSAEALQLTPQPEEVNAEDLHTLIAQLGAPDAPLLVVDVRSAEEFKKKNIAGSINQPFQELPYAELVERFHTLVQKSPNALIVFVSVESPDLDDLAAREFIEVHSKTLHCPPPAKSVRVLLGGLSHYFSLYP
ncbi:hypothetical protein AGDE_03614 [Angomonas deanei]|uniref:Rhodanese-like domain containing protein, putative n=1 Tax=Angomonas deanei TaxID=59799 RepID=S9VHI6_9TRYP|nr:hypothetical protein AGDE_05658 [Angomonas deanei]EPY40314.1 hypothetical protein AGDE_03614 [Angomonas deanei]CAD2217754.1 Rhodanese-like domain containing protein, putative [Angomonas deanei]|eukprot:EPY38271.1 hypothetical protein AGDE_05658 [Angomonas deanei]